MGKLKMYLLALIICMSSFLLHSQSSDTGIKNILSKMRTSGYEMTGKNSLGDKFIISGYGIYSSLKEAETITLSNLRTESTYMFGELYIACLEGNKAALLHPFLLIEEGFIIKEIKKNRNGSIAIFRDLVGETNLVYKLYFNQNQLLKMSILMDGMSVDYNISSFIYGKPKNLIKSKDIKVDELNIRDLREEDCLTYVNNIKKQKEDEISLNKREVERKKEEQRLANLPPKPEKLDGMHSHSKLFDSNEKLESLKFKSYYPAKKHRGIRVGNIDNPTPTLGLSSLKKNRINFKDIYLDYENNYELRFLFNLFNMNTKVRGEIAFYWGGKLFKGGYKLAINKEKSKISIINNNNSIIRKKAISIKSKNWGYENKRYYESEMDKITVRKYESYYYFWYNDTFLGKHRVTKLSGSEMGIELPKNSTLEDIIIRVYEID